MRMIFGQFVILLMVVLGYYSGFNNYSYPNHINIDMLLWTTLLLALGIWTFKHPKVAFPIIFIFYIATAVYRTLVFEDEILLYFLLHFIFIISMIIAIWGAFSKKKKWWKR